MLHIKLGFDWPSGLMDPKSEQQMLINSEDLLRRWICVIFNLCHVVAYEIASCISSAEQKAHKMIL